MKVKEIISKINLFFKDCPVKSKMMMIILAVSVVSTILTVAAFSVNGIVNIRKQMSTEFAITGTIIGDRVNTALVFENNAVALETLNALSANQDIQIACVYDQSNKIFAQYANGSITNANCPPVKSASVLFTNDRLKLYRDIIDPFDNNKIGSLYIESNLNRISSYVAKQVSIALVVILCVLTIAYLLAIKLQKIISQPLNYLINRNEIENKYFTPSKDYLDSNNEIVKLGYLLRSVFARLDFFERQSKILNRELQDLIKNSESTFNYLSNELKQPLEATMAFSDILNSRAIGKVDNEYLSYYNDVYLTVFYYYGIINDTIEFFGKHLKYNKGKQESYRAVPLFEELLKEVKDEGPNFLKDIKFSHDLIMQDNLPPLFLDRIILKDIIYGVIFVFSRYLNFLGMDSMTFISSAKIDETDLDAKRFKIEIICNELREESVAHYLENHRDYQNDVHLIRAKMQYLKYLASYGGGYLDYGNDLRYMYKITLMMPFEQLYSTSDSTLLDDSLGGRLADAPTIPTIS